MSTSQFQITFENHTIIDCFKNHYVVPDYQREYVWDLAQVQQLLSDLNEGYHADKSKDYFLGTIVTYANDNKFS
ncbi:MAG: DUF262 domain-containing protein [Eubacteriales bacterium]